MNLRAWNEWSDREPEPHMGGCIEAEYVNDKGHIAYAKVWLFHYSDARGTNWGHSLGTVKDGDYKIHHPRYHRWRFTGPLVPGIEGQGSAIMVWAFQDAPGELRCLSNHGGDEDWVALVPKGMEVPNWAESGTRFGCCDVSYHEYDDGRLVCIGAHA